MNKSELVRNLKHRSVEVTFENILDNSEAHSGGERDVNFLKFLVDNRLLILTEASLKRTDITINEEYYLERYKKLNYESDRHFLCRAVIQEELKKKRINTYSGVAVGNMDILRANSNFDIVAEDFSALIDVGLTPARNYFRGLTDLKVKNYLLTTYFDDYMDDIIFSVFTRANDDDFINTVRDYEEGFKLYAPNPQEQSLERQYYDKPTF